MNHPLLLSTVYLRRIPQIYSPICSHLLLYITPVQCVFLITHSSTSLILLSNFACLLACPSQDGYTPLHIATDRGRRTVVQTLIDYGADIYAAEKVRGQIILSCDDCYHCCRSCDITASLYWYIIT